MFREKRAMAHAGEKGYTGGGNRLVIEGPEVVPHCGNRGLISCA